MLNINCRFGAFLVIHMPCQVTSGRRTRTWRRSGARCWRSGDAGRTRGGGWPKRTGSCPCRAQRYDNYACVYTCIRKTTMCKLTMVRYSIYYSRFVILRGKDSRGRLAEAHWQLSMEGSKVCSLRMRLYMYQENCSTLKEFIKESVQVQFFERLSEII
jgi:hypothetical protein